MKIYSTKYIPEVKYKTTNQNSDKINQSSTKKSSALLLASLLSLSSLAQSDIDYSSINNNVERIITPTQIQDKYNNIRQKYRDDDIHLTEEEKIHRFAIFITLIGFLFPIFLGNKSCHKNNRYND